MKRTALALTFVLACLIGGYMMITPAKADGHADLCQQNLNQCLTGCDGATSCSDQCQTNYNGCMGQ